MVQSNQDHAVLDSLMAYKHHCLAAWPVHGHARFPQVSMVKELDQVFVIALPSATCSTFDTPPTEGQKEVGFKKLNNISEETHKGVKRCYTPRPGLRDGRDKCRLFKK